MNRFLIDFDLASIMTEDNKGSTFGIAPLRYHQGKKRCAMDDWESFLFAMCQMAWVPLEWFHIELDLETEKGESAALKMVGEMKANRNKIRVSENCFFPIDSRQMQIIIINIILLLLMHYICRFCRKPLRIRCRIIRKSNKYS